ncbi:hypothetical protein BJX63DRAFT_24985 [Aspergillus granulosus]|uniref:C2H2-type domain-containing protein n=1 Tax=Aspergillus granulosus TaxID=176169 RepID=A0ABR4H087_9EURO
MLSQFPSYDDSQPGLFMANQERNHSQHRYQNSDYSLVPSVPILEAVYCGESQLPAAQRQLPMESRDRSPFRQSSPLSAGYNNDMFQQSPVSNSPNAHPMLERQVESPNIISPKDAVMHDFDQSKDRKLPYLHQPDFELRQDDTLRLASSFPFIEPFPQLGQAQAPFQQFIFSQPQQGQQDSLLYQTPEFPAFLPQFESADGGTYTCTYHGCTQRFETLRKLQNHKRGAHRRTTTEDRRDGISRNSQAGPHRCDRANIRTGKPCGSIFSRPWDLTRHENTFHNAHKREFRCNFCTKKRIFSRNDALIRHIRVVHPVRQLARSG